MFQSTFQWNFERNEQFSHNFKAFNLQLIAHSIWIPRNLWETVPLTIAQTEGSESGFWNFTSLQFFNLFKLTAWMPYSQQLERIKHGTARKTSSKIHLIFPHFPHFQYYEMSWSGVQNQLIFRIHMGYSQFICTPVADCTAIEPIVPRTAEIKPKYPTTKPPVLSERQQQKWLVVNKPMMIRDR